MKRKRTVAERNVLVLFLSLLPFVVGIGFSLLKSSDMNYFGSAINISGSERMRTMLVANYVQQIEDNYMDGDALQLQESKEILSDELIIYVNYMDALKLGDEELDMKANNFPDIVSEMDSFRPLFDSYVEMAKRVIDDPSDSEAANFVVNNSLELKDRIHQVVEMYQHEYDADVLLKKKFDIGMLVIAAIVTFFGLMLTAAIRSHEYHANFDFLTKLHNRHNLNEFIKDKNPEEYSVFFIDLNKFKQINDTFGHNIGDEILVEVGKRLSSVFGSEGVFRYGGDEFIAVVKAGGNENDLIDLVGKQIDNPIFDSAGRSHKVGLAMGVVTKDAKISSWESVIGLADELMYNSKNITGEAVVCDDKEQAELQIGISEDLAKAFAKKEILPQFQSVYSLKDGKAEYFMMLGRWEYKDIIIKPSSLVQLLKRKGMIAELDKLLLKEVEEHFMAAGEDVRYMVSLDEDTIVMARENGLLELLETLNVDKERVVIKIQEDVLLNENISVLLSRITQMGYTFGVDNFTLDRSIRQSDKYDRVGIVKLGRHLVSSLAVSEDSRDMLTEYMKMLVKRNKKIIVDSQSGDDLGLLSDEITSNVYLEGEADEKA